jgi:uncharacterized protein
MHVFRIIKSFICCCAALAAFSATTALAAEITDDGNFFSSGTIRSASEKIQDLDHRYGYRIKVETIAALPAGEVDEVRKMSSGDRAKFFGHYLARRAAAEKLDLLIFASRDPKYLQVLPHKKLESAGFTTAMRDKMAAALIADFHAEKYDEALSAALAQLEQDFTTIHRKAPAQDHPGQNHAAPNRPAENHAARQPVPFEHPAPGRPAEGGGWFGPIALVALFVGGFLLIRRLIGGASGGYGGGNSMAGGGGGGGMMSNILGGVFGAVAGNWLYDSFLRPTAHGQEFDHPRSDGGWSGSGSNSGTDDYSADSYDTSGGGGDFGGGDSGGGDFGGGDGGGGDGGGGDF